MTFLQFACDCAAATMAYHYFMRLVFWMAFR